MQLRITPRLTQLSTIQRGLRLIAFMFRSGNSGSDNFSRFKARSSFLQVNTGAYSRKLQTGGGQMAKKRTAKRKAASKRSTKTEVIEILRYAGRSTWKTARKVGKAFQNTERPP